MDIISEFQTDRIAEPLDRWCDLWQGGMNNLLGGLQVGQGGDKGCQGGSTMYEGGGRRFGSVKGVA